MSRFGHIDRLSPVWTHSNGRHAPRIHHARGHAAGRQSASCGQSPPGDGCSRHWLGLCSRSWLGSAVCSCRAAASLAAAIVGEKAVRSQAESVFGGRYPALSTSEAWTDAILMAATRRTHLQMCCVTVSVDAVGSRSRSHIMARSSGSSLSPARSMKVVVTWRVECMWIKAFFIF